MSGRQDSNLRPSGPKPDALPPAPLPVFHKDNYVSLFEARRYYLVSPCTTEFEISQFGFFMPDVNAVLPSFDSPILNDHPSSRLPGSSNTRFRELPFAAAIFRFTAGSYATHLTWSVNNLTLPANKSFQQFEQKCRKSSNVCN